MLYVPGLYRGETLRQLFVVSCPPLFYCILRHNSSGGEGHSRSLLPTFQLLVLQGLAQGVACSMYPPHTTGYTHGLDSMLTPFSKPHSQTKIALDSKYLSAMNSKICTCTAEGRWVGGGIHREKSYCAAPG